MLRTYNLARMNQEEMEAKKVGILKRFVSFTSPRSRSNLPKLMALPKLNKKKLARARTEEPRGKEQRDSTVSPWPDNAIIKDGKIIESDRSIGASRAHFKEVYKNYSSQ